jgi:hypothetical protein
VPKNQQMEDASDAMTEDNHPNDEIIKQLRSPLPVGFYVRMYCVNCNLVYDLDYQSYFLTILLFDKSDFDKLWNEPTNSIKLLTKGLYYIKSNFCPNCNHKNPKVHLEDMP